MVVMEVNSPYQCSSAFSSLLFGDWRESVVLCGRSTMSWDLFGARFADSTDKVNS